MILAKGAGEVEDTRKRSQSLISYLKQSFLSPCVNFLKSLSDCTRRIKTSYSPIRLLYTYSRNFPLFPNPENSLITYWLENLKMMHFSFFIFYAQLGQVRCQDSQLPLPYIIKCNIPYLTWSHERNVFAHI